MPLKTAMAKSGSCTEIVRSEEDPMEKPVRFLGTV